MDIAFHLNLYWLCGIETWLLLGTVLTLLLEPGGKPYSAAERFFAVLVWPYQLLVWIVCKLTGFQ